MTDEVNDRNYDLTTLLDDKKAWQRLLESPEWGKLVAILQQQVDELQQVVLRPLMSSDEVYLREFQKGQLEGRLSITNTVETLISDLEIDIERKHEDD